jgi:hypothetical protein
VRHRQANCKRGGQEAVGKIMPRRKYYEKKTVRTEHALALVSYELRRCWTSTTTLNQCCAFAFVLESILLVLAVEIVLQGPKQTRASALQMSAFRGKADMPFCAAYVDF